tara:strand:+ start:193 stop:318 length:126 start_codon:yes stop_codon:yes gene_type:complete
MIALNEMVVARIAAERATPGRGGQRGARRYLHAAGKEHAVQ